MAMLSRPQIVGGFVAGALSTLLFHQGLVWLLGQAGLVSLAAWSWAPTRPFGVPAVLSLAFWGGLWGIAWAWLAGRLKGGGGLGLAFLFGAILPSLVAAAVVVPMKGGDPKIFLQPALLLGVLLINGVWGVGTEILLRLGRGRLW